MKNFASILMSLLSFGLFAQNNQLTINEILQQPEQKSGVYRIQASNLRTSVVNMSFGGAEIQSITNRKELKDAEIIRVDVIYTNFPKGEDMGELNKRRVSNLLQQQPNLLKGNNVTWRLVRQMYCQDESEARLLFHGAVIYYLPPQNAALSRYELDNYENLPKNGDVKITEDSLKRFNKDPIILEAMKRNNWKNPTIVADVTCSMYPYMRQLAYWFLLKMNKVEMTNLALFNDGDGIQNNRKKMGETGGIYTSSTSEYDVFRELLLEAVSHGCSGDLAENDVESILEAQKKFPKAKEIILIADNYSDMRDFELRSKIKVPVHVLLCGAMDRINLQYLNLARETGGSVHTLKEDLFDLISKSEGDTFILMGKKYVISNGEIVRKKPNYRKT